jgi:phosphate starvation-inducible protein PhoH and related proteins
MLKVSGWQEPRFVSQILNEHQRHCCDITLTPFDNRRLVSLCGRFDEHLRQIERRFNVEILNRGNAFQVAGKHHEISLAGKVLKSLYKQTDNGTELTPNEVHLYIQQIAANPPNEKTDLSNISIKTPNCLVKPRTKNQVDYLRNIFANDVNFGIGPAGTGKTFLAVACAISALEQQKVKRILLVRPMVEAGENLGFLPGDLAQKIDPYLRPLYDALYEMCGCAKVEKLLEQQIIEIAPLAYMRGRTLSDDFIILDESQNTTIEQMKMFLTRIGFNSTTVITGDITQIDLPKGKRSGLTHALGILTGIPNISFTHFQSNDIVRHPIVQKIVDAYAKDNDLHGTTK